MTTASLTDITPETLVDEIMAAHRETISVFIRRGMLCVGCPVGRIHTLREACGAHGVPLAEMMDELGAMRGSRTAGRRMQRMEWE